MQWSESAARDHRAQFKLQDTPVIVILLQIEEVLHYLNEAFSPINNLFRSIAQKIVLFRSESTTQSFSPGTSESLAAASESRSCMSSESPSTQAPAAPAARTRADSDSDSES